ncbi:MAG: energy-coupling factor transporter ATPase [Oscillospiraceae bacterium]|nr:energy-coupling factor transporter ATPase [Oscillospiraceae bacterium]
MEDTTLDPTKPILQVKDLTHVYSAGTPFEHVAIEQINLSIFPGELIGVIGHTGSGKSTLIQHLNGLLKPSSGQVLFKGENIWKDKKFTHAIRGRVGLVFQYPEYQLFEESCRKDIAFGPRNQGVSGDELEARVRRAAGFVGLEESLLDKSPFDLSGGQKRRVAIAGVIAMEPDVLILDEPTAGLDAAGRDSILENIRAYQRAQNAAVIMVSHSMEEVAELCSRLIVMNKGRVAMDGVPAEIFTHADELTEMGLSVPQVTTVFRLLREKGLALPADVYTVRYALARLLERKEGRPC